MDESEATYIELIDAWEAGSMGVHDIIARNPETLLEERHHSSAVFGGHGFYWDDIPLDIIQQLLERFPSAVQAKDKEGRLPLHALVAFGAPALNVLRFLMETYPDGVLETDHYSNTPLYLACFCPLLDVIQLLLETSGPDVIWEKNRKGATPLHNRFVFDSLEVVQCLVKAFPLAVKETDTYGSTPLHVAVQEGASFDVIQFLVEACPEAIKITDDENLTALHTAIECRRASLDVIRCLVEACPEAIKIMDDANQTALHVACDFGASRDVIRLLLHAYPDAILQKSRTGEIPLHLACLEGSLDVIEFLCNASPTSVLEKANNGRLPLHVACFHCDVSSDVVEFLLSRMSPREYDSSFVPSLISEMWDDRTTTPLQIQLLSTVASLQDLAGVPILQTLWQKTELLMMWAQGRDLQDPTRDDRPWFIVHVLAELNIATIVVWFASKLYPDQVQTRNDLGLFPIQHALKHATPPNGEDSLEHRLSILRDPSRNLVNESVAWHLFYSSCAFREERPFQWKQITLGAMRQFVEGCPAAVQRKDRDGRLPLHEAVSVGAPDFDLIRFLVKAHPAGVSAQDNYGDTPLHLSCFHPSLDIIRLLVETVGPGEAVKKNRKGATPLHNYNVFGSLEVVRCLLEALKSALKEQDADGKIPLHIALKGGAGARDVVQCLMEAWPDAATVTDKDGRGALHIACRYGASVESLQLLLQAYPDAIFLKRRTGEIPLHYACKQGGLDMVQFLCERSSRSVLAKADNGRFPLHGACLKENVSSDVVEFLLSRMPLCECDGSFVPALITEMWGLFCHPYPRRRQLLSNITSLRDLAAAPELHEVLTLWQKTELLMMWAQGRDLQDPTRNGRPWFIVHALVELNIPAIVVWFALKLYPDQLQTGDHLGLFPIHYALNNSSLASGEDALQSRLSFRRVLGGFVNESVAWHLFRQNPALARCAGMDGWPLLHKALRTGAGYRPGDRELHDIIESIIRVVPQTLAGRDPVSGMRPFQLAASNGCFPLNMTYMLLRADPSQLHF